MGTIFCPEGLLTLIVCDIVRRKPRMRHLRAERKGKNAIKRDIIVGTTNYVLMFWNARFEMFWNALITIDLQKRIAFLTRVRKT